MLEKVKDSKDLSEKNPHEAHGVEGYRLNSAISERKYKKKSKKKKAKKSKKKIMNLYPYFAGDNMFASDFGDGEGGDSGGGE